jgi:hypothetical protein
MDEAKEIRVGRLLWGGPLVVALSVADVLLIRAVGAAAVHPSAKFAPLTVQVSGFDAMFGGACAVFAFYSMCRYGLEPIREYRSLAWKVLLVSFLPDVALALAHLFGSGWPEALVLMAMHVAVWGICVTMLPLIVVGTARV